MKIATTRAGWSRAQRNARLEELDGDLASIREHFRAGLAAPPERKVITAAEASALFAHALQLAAADLEHYDAMERGERHA